MNKIRLTVKSVTEIVGNKDVGLVVLVDENEQRQIAIPCDYQMLYQLQLRIQISLLHLCYCQRCFGT